MSKYMKWLLTTTVVLALVGNAIAAETEIGQQDKAFVQNGQKVTTVTIKVGDTIKFKITNVGTVDHEFVLDDETKMMEHKAEMAKFPEMEHADPNSIRLEPGAKGEIIWKFSASGEFQFACLIPGHMEAGMHGPVLVN